MADIAHAAGLSEKRLIDIEKMPTAEVPTEGTLHRLAKAYGMKWDDLDEDWQKTPVFPAKMKNGGTRTGFRNIRVPADVYDALVRFAVHEKMTVEEYLADHVQQHHHGTSRKPGVPSGEGVAPQPSASHAHGKTA